MFGTADEQEPEHDEGAREVAHDHHRAAVEAVGDEAREWAEEDHRQKACDEHEPDGAARAARDFEDKRVEGDGVEPIAELAHDLPEPQQAEVAVAAKQFHVADRGLPPPPAPGCVG